MRFVFKTSYLQDLGLFRDGVQRAWYVALLAGLLVLPLVLRDYLVDISLVFIYGLCGLSLMVLAGYTGLCPRVEQSGERDRRGPLTKRGPRYLRWALIEAAQHAARHPAYQDLCARKKAQHPGPRGNKIAAITVARKLSEAIWHMLTHDRPFAPAGATLDLAA